jgi:fucose permease
MRHARLGVAFAIFTLVGINLGGGGVLLPAQIDDYGVDKTTMGAIFWATSVGYGLSAAANGALIHRFGVRSYLLTGAAVALAAAVAIAVRTPFPLFVALQGALGFGIGALEAALNSYLSTLERPTALLNSLHAFFGVGAVIGPVLAATLLSQGYAWTTFYVVVAALIVPLLAGLLLYPRIAKTDSSDERPRFSRALVHRGVWLGGLFLALYVGVEISVGNWTVSFLTEDRGHGVVAAGWAVSGYWLGLTAGRFLLNRLFDRLGVGVVGMIAVCLAGTVASAAAVWLVPGGAIVGLALLGFCLGPMYPTMIAVMPRLVPAALVATAIGLVVSLSVGGGALFPFLAGAIAQRFGTWSLFPLAIGLTGLVAVVWWLIARRLTRPVVAADVGPVPVRPWSP